MHRILFERVHRNRKMRQPPYLITTYVTKLSFPRTLHVIMELRIFRLVHYAFAAYLRVSARTCVQHRIQHLENSDISMTRPR